MPNLPQVIRQLGLLLLGLSAALLAVALVAMPWLGVRGEEAPAQWAMVSAALIGAVSGLLLYLAGRRAGPSLFGRREALLLVATSWLLGAALGALPYYLWTMWAGADLATHPFASFTNCYFESMSGLTTTGATILSDIEALPRVLLLWRATTQWLGGLGIIVLFVAVLPTLGVGGKRLFQSEATGPTKTGVRPRIRETARVLWLIYLAMTVALALLLWLQGMELFDSVCHTFATLATGGFSTRNASIAAFPSWGIQMTIVLFMVLGGVNFGLYYQLMRRRWQDVWRDPELRLYLAIILVVTLVIGGMLVRQQIHTTAGQSLEPGVRVALQHALFQVVSIMTTTGFGTADFNLWGFPAHALLVFLMFVGGCAGSTGGGIKVIRVLITLKVMAAEIERVFRPNVVRTIRVGRGSVDPEMRQATLVYVLSILLLFALGTIALMLFDGRHGLDIISAASASAATLHNIGPGLELVGPINNYGFFSAPSKIVMALLMALGRLEMYALLVVLTWRFWRTD